MDDIQLCISLSPRMTNFFSYKDHAFILFCKYQTHEYKGYFMNFDVDLLDVYHGSFVLSVNINLRHKS